MTESPPLPLVGTPDAVVIRPRRYVRRLLEVAPLHMWSTSSPSLGRTDHESWPRFPPVHHRPLVGYVGYRTDEASPFDATRVSRSTGSTADKRRSSEFIHKKNGIIPPKC